jgi:hypothetical protein
MSKSASQGVEFSEASELLWTSPGQVSMKNMTGTSLIITDQASPGQPFFRLLAPQVSVACFYFYYL